MDVITHYNTSTLHISGGIQFVIKYSNICDERTSLRLAGRQLCSSLPIQAPDIETVPYGSSSSCSPTSACLPPPPSLALGPPLLGCLVVLIAMAQASQSSRHGRSST